MRLSRSSAVLSAAMAFIVALCLQGAHAAYSPGEKVLVPSSGSVQTHRLELSDEDLIVDRGSFQVYSIPASAGKMAADIKGAVPRPDFDFIELRREHIDVRQGPAFAPESMRARPKGPRLMLVQFAGPPVDDDLNMITSAGADIVHYVPQNAYMVWADDAAASELGKLLASEKVLQYVGEYHPWYALAPSLDSAVQKSGLVDVTVQIYNHRGGLSAAKNIALSAAEVVRHPQVVLDGKYINLTVRVPGTALSGISSIPGVVNVERYVPNTLCGERQGQIIAGNLNTAKTQPVGPGYLAFLASHSFPTTPGDYPIVVVADDGFDNGNATSPGNAEFRQLNTASNPSRVVFAEVAPGASISNPNGVDGHGNINVSIVGGYNSSTGFPYEDSLGYNYGLGISPYGRMASSKIFADGGSWAGPNEPLMVHNQYANGVRISSNSWGASVNGEYNTDSQMYDSFVRDSQPSVPGLQEMTFFFSAGNNGSSSNTIGSPGTAKNVITVGASENWNATGVVDGCGIGNSGADNAQDIISFSSRGPCNDGRVKPDIMGPGTHIQGAASTASNYNGSGVCDQYMPAGQTRYAWSSGTSHSCPALAGCGSLIHNYLARVHSLANPSPALTKAYIAHAGRHLTGVSANDNLPSNNQGYGIIDLSAAFGNTVLRQVIDQSEIISSSGDTFELSGTVDNTSEPVVIALAWTDPPGPTSGNAYVNDLDLEVRVNGVLYLGNVMAKDISQTGGTPDIKNNCELVRLPAGTTGNIVITVRGTTIAGDGVPGNGDSTDQDFALVAYNIATYVETPTFSPPGGRYLEPQSVTISCQTPDAVIRYTLDDSEPNENSIIYTGVPINISTTTTLKAAAWNGEWKSAVRRATYTIQLPCLIEGTVTDAISGMPLYAGITISDYPDGKVWTDPLTGYYSVVLGSNWDYELTVEAWSPGYQTATRSLTALAGNRVENFQIAINLTDTVLPPGYAGNRLLEECFDSGVLPDGWTVIDAAGNGAVWRFDNPGGRSNYTGGGGGFAIVDSDYAGQVNVNTQLCSPVLDCSGLPSVVLSYKSDFLWYEHGGSEVCDVDVSINGSAGPWTNVRRTTTNELGPRTITIDLSSIAAGKPNVMIRWRYYNANYDWWWQIDDVMVSDGQPPALLNGGLVVGNVYNIDTFEPLVGSSITNSRGDTVPALRTPEDPAVDDAFFVIFAEEGSDTLTAAMQRYDPESADVQVSNGQVIRRNFYLADAPSYLLEGTVTDVNTGWPLYAAISISGHPGGKVWTDPFTGHYSVELTAGIDYTLTVNTWSSGYESVSRTLTSFNGYSVENFALDVLDSAAVLPPGYPNPYVLVESFDNGVLPVGWTVRDNTGAGAVWLFNDPEERGNMTGGVGGFAIADSDHFGWVNMNTELRTPLLDCSGLPSVILSYKSDFMYYASGGNEVCDVDVSINGINGPWTNVRRITTNERGPRTITIDLSSIAAGKSNVMIRWRYYNANYDWWWQIDDVRVHSGSGTYPMVGGLIVGNVYRCDTSDPAVGAMVSCGDQSTYTAATPEDPAVDDGFYILFAPSGMQTVSAEMEEYGSAESNVEVSVGEVSRLDLCLSMGYLTCDPAVVDEVVLLGSAVSLPLQLKNEGGSPVTFSISGSGPSAPWLSVNQTAGTIGSYETLTIGLTLDAGAPEVSAPGEYHAVLRISSNAPNPEFDIPVKMTVVASAHSIDQAKRSADGASVYLADKTVTAVFADSLYIEENDRNSGIRIEMSEHGMWPGMRATVSGTMSTNADGERSVDALTVREGSGVGEILPIGMTAKNVGGADWYYNPGTGAGQRGVLGGFGLNNIGLLVSVMGRVSHVGSGFFHVDDGSAIPNSPAYPGVKVLAADLSLPSVESYVKVSGISSCISSGGALHRVIRVWQQEAIEVVSQ